jgi:DEAD/DEAH box helicase domain-containing protein
MPPPSDALRSLFDPGRHGQVVAVAHEAARRARLTDLPPDLCPGVRAALERSGVTRLFAHQRTTWDLLQGGANVILATGTASGKSLAFTLPTLQAIAADPQSRALYLYPTKALAQDQLRKLGALRAPGASPAVYDGDTPADQRAAIRRTTNLLLSNPDMLHVGVLPAHERWAEFLHHLRFVVLDEAHVYRGVFGSHVAQVVRRLRRLCAAYGAEPRFVLASATIAAPHAFAERLTGLPFTAVEDDGAPRHERAVVFWNPPLEDPAQGTRRSALAEAAYVASEAVLGGARVIAFAPTRKAAELVFGAVRRRLEERDPAAADRVQPYRAGYTPQQRRDIERRLFEHELDAVVATSALELGIDVGELDVALVTGFPGTVTSLRQRWGRAGRRGHGYAVLVAGQDALDQYFVREPERLLSRSVEEAVIDLHNPHISGPHLEAAAYERPLTAADEAYFGERGLLVAERLAQGGRLRRRGDGLAWARPHSPAAETSLRSAASQRFVIVESRDGSILGTLEAERVFRFAHPGAVYLHLGESYLVRQLDLEQRLVLVDDFLGAYYTQAKVDKHVLIAGQGLPQPLADGASLFFGEIEVTEQVVAYQKRDVNDGRVLDTTALDLPEQVFTTEALWLTLTPELLQRALTGLPEEDTGGAAAGRAGDAAAHDAPHCLRAAGVAAAAVPDDAAGSAGGAVPPAPGAASAASGGGDHGPCVPGALHAAEHVLIALLPLYAMCDRWDVGGLSTPWHPQTDLATIFVYDGYPGGIGLSRRAHDAFAELAADARRLVAECPCEDGCPSCVQSPKCGNLNEPLSKAGAARLLDAVLAGGARPDGGGAPDGGIRRSAAGGPPEAAAGENGSAAARPTGAGTA